MSLAEDLAPRRQRTDRPQVVPLEQRKMTDTEMRSNAFRVAQGIEDMQKERDANRAEISDLRAQLDQHRSRITEMQSERETIRLELAAERNARIRYQTFIENQGNAIAAFMAPADHEPEDEQD